MLLVPTPTTQSHQDEELSCPSAAEAQDATDSTPAAQNVCPESTPSLKNLSADRASVRPSNRPPVLPSFPGSADTSISCSSPSGCLSCPGCVDSSSVSRHGGALHRHGHWSGAGALSADGQAAIFYSHAGLCSKFSFGTKVYFTCSLTCCRSQPPFSCDPFPIHQPHPNPPTTPSMADHLAG